MRGRDDDVGRVAEANEAGAARLQGSDGEGRNRRGYQGGELEIEAEGRETVGGAEERAMLGS